MTNFPALLRHMHQKILIYDLIKTTNDYINVCTEQRELYSTGSRLSRDPSMFAHLAYKKPV